MFGFTYLAVGINSLASCTGDGPGWCSPWVSLVAIGYTVVNLVR